MEGHIQRNIYTEGYTQWYIYIMGLTQEGKIYTARYINQRDRYMKDQAYRGTHTRKNTNRKGIYNWKNKYIEGYTYRRAIYMEGHIHKGRNTQSDIT